MVLPDHDQREDRHYQAGRKGIVLFLHVAISEHTINGLRSRGVVIGNNHRSPIQVQSQDFEQACTYIGNAPNLMVKSIVSFATRRRT